MTLSDLLYDEQTDMGMPACDKIDTLNRSRSSRECKGQLAQALRGIFSQYSSDDKSVAILSLPGKR